MLASLAHQHPFATSHNYLPAIPSPLSPRSANIYGRSGRIFMSSSSPSSENESIKSHTSTSTNSRNVAFSKRSVKKAPSPKQDELKDRRRSLFLKKVKDEREEKRFEARGDDIMRLDFVQRQKRWEAQLASEAEAIGALDPPEDENEQPEIRDVYDLPGSSGAMQVSAPSTQQQQQTSVDYEVDAEADEVAQREQAELEWLVASYMEPDVDDDVYGYDDGDQSQHLYSDDDDYDALFAEMVEQSGVQQQENVPPPLATRYGEDDADAMDVS